VGVTAVECWTSAALGVRVGVRFYLTIIPVPLFIFSKRKLNALVVVVEHRLYTLKKETFQQKKKNYI
jgi:uncharacterized membrane protein YhiD involved in acid resistance